MGFSFYISPFSFSINLVLLQQLAKKGEEFIDLHYAVEGMDVSISRILSFIEATAVEKLNSQECTPADLCYSLQVLKNSTVTRKF